MKRLLSAFACLVMLCGCGASNASKSPETMDRIQTDVHATIREYLLAQDTQQDEALFADGKMPMYEVTRFKRGDENFDAYLQSLGFEPTAVQDVLHLQPIVNAKSDNVLVMRVNDMEKTKQGLANTTTRKAECGSSTPTNMKK